MSQDVHYGSIYRKFREQMESVVTGIREQGWSGGRVGVLEGEGEGTGGRWWWLSLKRCIQVP